MYLNCSVIEPITEVKCSLIHRNTGSCEHMYVGSIVASLMHLHASLHYQDVLFLLGRKCYFKSNFILAMLLLYFVFIFMVVYEDNK